ncbi:uncharacterized protein LOC108666594 isoform X3 [Hyalella azteca]|uniref:Uncharacterized protein LOC108666594 isoform X3 n=1 Tax=Hyalella azteca TaxID=294128 RepID=A0A8B7N5W3_HYAAZ|nr:uncharacterized protein LOC108666594 isoform X3 [Hyalella azteca]
MAYSMGLLLSLMNALMLTAVMGLQVTDVVTSTKAQNIDPATGIDLEALQKFTQMRVKRSGMLGPLIIQPAPHDPPVPEATANNIVWSSRFSVPWNVTVLPNTAHKYDKIAKTYVEVMGASPSLHILNALLSLAEAINASKFPGAATPALSNQLHLAAIFEFVKTFDIKALNPGGQTAPLMRGIVPRKVTAAVAPRLPHLPATDDVIIALTELALMTDVFRPPYVPQTYQTAEQRAAFYKEAGAVALCEVLQKFLNQ